MIKYLAAAAAAYIIGSFSFAIFVSSHFLGGDIRTKGSGNPGATNMARVYGIWAGIGTVVWDIGKAFIAAHIGKLLCGSWGTAIGCMGCVVGHCFPLFYGFKGGKAVATGAAVGFLAGPVPFITCLAAFFAGAIITKKVSLGSILAALGMAVAAILVHIDTPLLIMVLFTDVVVILRHRENIRRLINGTEPDFHPGHRK